MPVDVDTDELAVAMADLSKEEAGEAARRWSSRSQEVLTSEGSDEDYEVFPVVQSFQPAEWTGDAWRFTILHRAARYFEFGTTQHEIKAQDAETLAFEWPDAPQEVRDMFEATFPMVFFPRTEVDGITALHYLERGKQAARRWLEG